MVKLSQSLPVALTVALGVTFSSAFIVVSELTHQRVGTAIRDLVVPLQAKVLLGETAAALNEAESAQHSFLLTGRATYLKPYHEAPKRIQRATDQLRALWVDNPLQLARLAQLNHQADQRFGELDAVIGLYRSQGEFAAIKLIESDPERKSAGAFDKVIASAITDETQRYEARRLNWSSEFTLLRGGAAVLSTINLILLILCYLHARRELGLMASHVESAESRRLEVEQIADERTTVLSELASSQQEQQERERAKIARDIHDELGSAVISARMDVTYVLTKLRNSDPDLAEKLESAIQNLDDSIDIKRRLIEELRPSVLDTLGLAPAIEWLAQQVCKRAELTLHLSLEEDLTDMPEHVAITLYRITQEALTNIVKYAKASEVSIKLFSTNDTWGLTIKDDGIGLPGGAMASRLSHGLIGMRQRALGLKGSFTIATESGHGVTIQVRVPRPT